MLRQALNLQPVKGDATMVSMGENEHLVMEDFASVIKSRCTETNKITIPDSPAW